MRFFWRRTTAAIAVAALVGAASCSRGKQQKAIPTTIPPTTTTTVNVALLPGNPRVTTTLPAEIQGGTARLIGAVTGPTGGVEGATVRVERFVGDRVAGVDVKTVAGGGWELAGIRGGRYRLRAWRPPDLAQVQPDVVFLAADEAKTVNLLVGVYDANSAAGTYTPSPPPVGTPSVLTVLLSGATVDPEGVVRIVPRTGVPVQLAVSGGLTVQSPANQVTDATGRASWRVLCTLPGASPVGISLAPATTLALDVPPCGGTLPSTTVP